MRKEIDHTARARLAWPVLAKCAKNGKRISYGKLANAIGLHHRSARWFLCIIQEECRRQKLPPLQALAVNKATGFPGSGYVASKRKGKAYGQVLEQVAEYNWPNRAPF